MTWEVGACRGLVVGVQGFEEFISVGLGVQGRCGEDKRWREVKKSSKRGTQISGD